MYRKPRKERVIITLCSEFFTASMLVSGRSLLRFQRTRVLSSVVDTGIPLTAEHIKHKMGDDNVKDASVAEATRKKIVLFGGNGFVGQAMVEAALRQGIDVISISRSGGPVSYQPPAFAPGKIEWKVGDITVPDSYNEALPGATGAISCVGAFGSNEVALLHCLLSHWLYFI